MWVEESSKRCLALSDCDSIMIISDELVQRGKTEEILRRNDPGCLRQYTYPKAIKSTPGLQSPVQLKKGGRRSFYTECNFFEGYAGHTRDD